MKALRENPYELNSELAPNLKGFSVGDVIKPKPGRTKWRVEIVDLPLRQIQIIKLGETDPNKQQRTQINEEKLKNWKLAKKADYGH